jgi:hypothetical protein
MADAALTQLLGSTATLATAADELNQATGSAATVSQSWQGLRKRGLLVRKYVRLSPIFRRHLELHSARYFLTWRSLVGYPTAETSPAPTRIMSKGAEAASPSSSRLLDDRESLDSQPFLENKKRLYAKARSCRALHAWSWAGQVLLFFISIFIAFRNSAKPNCVQKLSTYCQCYSRHSLVLHLTSF